MAISSAENIFKSFGNKTADVTFNWLALRLSATRFSKNKGVDPLAIAGFLVALPVEVEQINTKQAI